MRDKLKRYRHHCVRCGHDWNTITEFPDRCGSCNDPAYDIPRGHAPINLLGTHVNPPGTGKKAIRAQPPHAPYGNTGSLGRG